MDLSNERLLVVSAHAADFVWRAGGAIALYASRGARVRALCLSYGERGESQGLWKKEGMTIELVKQVRHEEASKAAEALGAEIRFFDAGDYPLKPTDELIEELVQEFRGYQPTCVMTHTPVDPYNGDHGEASRLTMNARIYAQAMGYPSPHKHLGAPPLFYFEPHQTEMCRFKPDVILDITPVFETKVRAMHCMEAQTHLWNYYTDAAKRRGTQGGRNSGNPQIIYAEAFQRVYPQVITDVLR
ncbi:MAG: PIG-L family deacetylase [Chloracidobacterium sp.]|nr:PIG-L family deacetylase [Chloracidobacterium sp.]